MLIFAAFQVNETIRPYSRKFPLVTVLCVVLITSTIIYGTKAYDSKSVGVIAMVSDVLTNGDITEKKTVPGVSHLGGLVISFLMRVSMTLLGTNIPIPAGIFMPVFLIGGIVGRFVGIIMSLMLVAVADIDVSAYALVGACAFAAGVTHTISVAVIAVEMTGNIHLLLPCLLVSVIAAGITKSKGSSVYDQGMMNKGLESFQLLLMGSTAFHTAGEIMDKDACSIPIRCSLADLINILKITLDIQEEFPLIDSLESRHVIGTVARGDLYEFVELKCSQKGQMNLIAEVLSRDHKRHRVNLKRSALKIQQTRERRKYMNSLWSKINEGIKYVSLFQDSPTGATGHVPLKNMDGMEEGRVPAIIAGDQENMNPIHETVTVTDSTAVSTPKTSPRSSITFTPDFENIANVIATNTTSLAREAERLTVSAANATAAGISDLAKRTFESGKAAATDAVVVRMEVLEEAEFTTPFDISTDASALRINRHPFSSVLLRLQFLFFYTLTVG
jgi:hypothetical protein